MYTYIIIIMNTLYFRVECVVDVEVMDILESKSWD